MSVIKLKHSKIKSMRRGQEGMASMVVVTMLAVVITLISLGFARIMNRAIINSENRQASNAATYAAESGINDVGAYIKSYAIAHPGQAQPYSANCTGSNSLIGSSSNPGPFYNDSNLSGNGTTQYSCILLNQTPNDIAYQAINSNSSQVVRMTTSAYPGSLDKIMISWQPSTNPQTANYPPNIVNPYTNSLKDESTWNSNTNNYLPMLRVTLYPIPQDDSITNVQANSKTIFLYPQASSGTVPAINYSNVQDGSIQPVNCTTNVAANSFNGTADYACNIIINNLTLATTQPASSPTDFFYVRLMPIYNTSDVKIKANDQWSQSLKFVNVQAIVDVTAKSDQVSKRLQARLDISCLTSQPCENLQATSYSAPEYTVRSATAICKRLLEYVSYYNYAQEDGPAAICNQLSQTVYTPAPTLTLSITGSNGTDNNKTVDSAAVNPDSPQNPVQNGTVYINNATVVNWKSTDSAIACNASGNWSGDKNPSSSWSGSTGTGSQSFAGISTYQTYNMQCIGPGGTTATKTVHAWPQPSVNFSGSSSSYHDGNNYTIQWNSNSATSCNITSTGNKPWSQSYSGLSPSGASDSRSFSTSGNDASTKTYTITCTDPIGRSTSRTWVVSTNGDTQIQSPSCSATIGPDPAPRGGHDNGDGTGYWNWGGSCQGQASPAWQLVNCSGPNIYCGSLGASGTQSLGVGNYQNRLIATASAWGTVADSGLYQWNVNVPPVHTTIYPYTYTGFTSYTWTWGTSNNQTNDCRDGVHTYIFCLGISADEGGDSSRHSDPDPRGIVGCTVNGTFYNNDFGQRHWSSAGNWINVTLGYNSGPGQSTTTTVTCTGKQGGSDTKSATDHWHTCEERGQIGQYYSDYSNNNCSNPPTGGGGGGSSGGGGGGSGGGSTPPPATCPVGYSGTPPNCTPAIGCFIAGTMIATLNGSKPIENIKVGDVVQSYDISSGKVIRAPVTQTFVHQSQPTLWIVTSGGSVVTTSVHPFWDGGKWVKAGDLVAGKSYVQDSNGKLQKVLLTMYGSKQTVYNLEVGNSNHDYFANGFLVHNKFPPE